MKLRKALVCGVVGLGLSVGFISLTGCASDREKARESGMSAAEDFNAVVKKFNPQIDKVNASLNKLIAGNTADRYSAYTAYNADVAIMQDHAERLRKEAASMQADAGKYFAAWDKELAKTRGTTKREAGEAERATSRGKWNQVQEYLANANTKYRATLDQYLGIRETLKNNLTPNAIAGVMPSVERSAKDSMDLKNVLSALSSTLDNAINAK